MVISLQWYEEQVLDNGGRIKQQRQQQQQEEEHTSKGREQNADTAGVLPIYKRKKERKKERKKKR